MPHENQEGLRWVGNSEQSRHRGPIGSPREPLPCRDPEHELSRLRTFAWGTLPGNTTDALCDLLVDGAVLLYCWGPMDAVCVPTQEPWTLRELALRSFAPRHYEALRQIGAQVRTWDGAGHALSYRFAVAEDVTDHVFSWIEERPELSTYEIRNRIRGYGQGVRNLEMAGRKLTERA